jgi:hypothetical protein
MSGSPRRLIGMPSGGLEARHVDANESIETEPEWQQLSMRMFSTIYGSKPSNELVRTEEKITGKECE